MGKGEVAHYEQFLLFPQCFKEACFQGASKGVIVWEWVTNTFPADNPEATRNDTRMWDVSPTDILDMDMFCQD